MNIQIFNPLDKKAIGNEDVSIKGVVSPKIFVSDNLNLEVLLNIAEESHIYVYEVVVFLVKNYKGILVDLVIVGKR